VVPPPFFALLELRDMHTLYTALLVSAVLPVNAGAFGQNIPLFPDGIDTIYFYECLL